ncbi:Flavodoxin [Ruminococcus sp. YE71]|uniref:flavodoxin n=1 Tax=unclassified Ruminococcus TaxID=2608920 RepID=UPI000885E8BA|nr:MULTISPECIES: flavodoxin [unclassified Ruminococcus]SDA28805.1 Flavodoxin [Ruminococcus sp. YE78]SFW46990.1 Flavodoxin [Ruminococcus sp. YE71]
MKKVIISLAAVFCMLGFTACGNTDNSSSPAADTSAQTQADLQGTESQQTEQSAEVTESEQSDEEKAAPEQTAEQPQTDGFDENTGADTIVVYFSATGTTKGVAERIASVTNADIYELIPAELYSDADLDWNDKNSRTTIEMNDPNVRPAIANDTVDLDGYTTVYIGYPIWWGDAPRMMSTFVEAHDFDGKTVIPFCTSGGSGIGRSGSNLASQAGSGNWLDGNRLDANISESEIQDWINGMN